MSILAIHKSTRATHVSFTDSKMVVYLADGRELSVPLEWFPRLRDATQDQLKSWRFIGNGEGIHWEELDEDISVKALLE